MARKPERDVVTGVDLPWAGAVEKESAKAIASVDPEATAVDPEAEPEPVADEAEPAPPPRMSSFDLIGEDGRRILRWQTEAECRATGARILATTGEETEVIESPAPVDTLRYPGRG